MNDLVCGTARRLPALEFETPRLQARWLAEHDERFFCDLYDDPATMRFVGPCLGRDRAARAFRRVLQDMSSDRLDRLFLLVFERHLQRPIGLVTVQHVDARERTAETGIILLAAFAGQGYAREAVAALMTRVFGTLTVDYVRAFFLPDNKAAERVLTSLGFSDVEAAPVRPDSQGLRARCLRRDAWSTGSQPLPQHPGGQKENE